MSNKQTKWFGCRLRKTLPTGESAWVWVPARCVLVLALAGVAVYLGGATAGYFWFKHARGAEDLRFSSVLLLRSEDVKASIASAHLKAAREAKAKKELQKAYVSYVSALRASGRDSVLRLEVADFLASVGAGKQAMSILEQGLAFPSGRDRLGLRLLGLLSGQGQDVRILTLFKGPLAEEFSGKRAMEFKVYQVQSVLAVEGHAAALALLKTAPRLVDVPGGALAAARVHWAAGERNEAIQILLEPRRRATADLATLSVLSEYLEATGRILDLKETAKLAKQRFPTEPAARLLLISSLRGVNLAGSEEWREEVEAYLSDFRRRPEALLPLAELGGRRGWVDFTKMLYTGSLAAGRLSSTLALCYSDALLRAGKVSDAREVLDELATQLGDEPAFAVYIRRRQVIAAAAAGATLAVRDHARSLAVLLASDPDSLDATRRQFAKVGLKEAAAEMGFREPAKTAQTAPAKNRVQ